MSKFLIGVKSYTVFFLLIMVLLHLVPKEGYRKYIQFFMEMLLVFVFLSPVVAFLFDSDEFLELVEDEMIQEQMEELEKDTHRIEFLQQDYYVEQCKKMIEREVEQITQEFGYEIIDNQIFFDAEDKLEKITLRIQKQENDITIRKIQIGREEKVVEQDCEELREILQTYYQLEEDSVSVSLEAS